MSHLVMVPATQPDDHMVERTGSYKLSFDLHMCTVTYIPRSQLIDK